MPHTEEEVKRIVQNVLSSFQGRSVNDEDEVGTASAWKYNIKGLANLEDETRNRGRTGYDQLTQQVSQMGNMLLHWFNQSAFNADIAGKNLVFNTNLTHKNALFDSSLIADESLVTSEEALVNMVVAKVMKELANEEE